MAAGQSPLEVAGVTIARAAKAAGLSRTTLMYYERLGLIRPVRRAGSRYRTFRPDDLRTLALIARWRALGLPLATVRRLLAHPDEAPQALRDHLVALDRSAAALRVQRRLTLAMLEGRPTAATPAMDKKAWSAMFRAIGLTDAQMRAWHAQFEARAPAAHAAFLVSLGLGRAEVGRIRRWSRA